MCFNSRSFSHLSVTPLPTPPLLPPCRLCSCSTSLLHTTPLLYCFLCPVPIHGFPVFVLFKHFASFYFCSGVFLASRIASLSATTVLFLSRYELPGTGTLIVQLGSQDFCSVVGNDVFGLPLRFWLKSCQTILNTWNVFA